MEDLNLQIQEIISANLTWEKLTPEQKALFNNSEDIFNSLTSDFKTGSTVNAALLEDLVNQMHADEPDSELKASLTKYSLDQQKLIEKMVAAVIAERNLKKTLENKAALDQIGLEVDKLDTKQNPRQEIIKIANQVIGSSSKVAVEKFIAICLTSNLDLSDPQDLELAKTIALGKNQLYKEVSRAITTATDPDYIQAIENPDSRHSGLSRIITPDGFTIDTSKLPSPTQVKTPPAIKVTPLSSDLGDRLTAEVGKLHQIENNPQALKISHTLITQISDKQLDQITHAINQIDPTILQPATPAGQKAAAILKQFPNSTLSSQAIKLYSQGLTYQQWSKIYQKTGVSPQQAYVVNQQLKSLDNSNLGREITQPLGKAGRAFQTLTNRFSSKLPSGFTKPLNYILHPVQSIKGWFGKQVGKRIGVKIYKAFARKVTNKTARLVAKTLLREGIKAGAKTLFKEGAKLAAKTLAKFGIEAGLLAGGVTAPIALIMLALDAVVFVAKKIWGGVQNIAQSIWGEKIKARDVLALPAMAIASGSAILASLGTATVAAASSAAGVVAAAAAAGVFLYITAFTVAPLISTIAQLESVPGMDYVINPPSGPIPPGCPSIWPTASGRITQGPKTSSTHYGSEAIDIGVGMGTPILTTHPGKAIAVGSSGPYGNYVDVYGICQGINYITRYAHMPSVPFYGEKLVNTGDQIGVVNNTGNSTGNHLHYEIRGGALGDINQFLPKPVRPGCIEYIQCLVNIP